MSWLSCFSLQIDLSDYTMCDVKNKKSLCMICRIKVQKNIMECQYCHIAIGHKSCLHQWLVRRGCCPNCLHTSC